MAKLDEFKEFVKGNPKLINHVKDGSMSWQKFYEIYDLYGDSNDAWKDYLGVATTVAAASTLGLPDIVNWFKSLNVDSIQTGVNNLQRVLGVVQDLTTKDSKTPKEEHKPRPIYKHFDD